MTTQSLDSGTALIDLHFQGQSSAIGTGVIEYAGGVGLVDPGPTTCLGSLRRGLEELGFSLSDVRAVLLTHIHLDHATATGTILREAPEARVYVHPLGAIHMKDPERLLASAGRIYGEEMATLWGEFLPVPAASVVEVSEGDVVELEDRAFQIAYVPGHAKHHVAYFESDAGMAWVGDVGGIRVPPGGAAIPVTPPPDVDVELWNESMDRILDWAPDRIVPTHFGPVDDPERHFAELRVELESWSQWVRNSLRDDDPSSPDPTADQARARDFAAWAQEGLSTRMPREALDTYVAAFGATDSWWGLARYWRKKA